MHNNTSSDMISDPRLTVMFGISLLLHATAAAILGQNTWSAAVPGGFNNLEVRLVGSAPPWPDPSVRTPHNRESATPSATIPVSGGDHEESMVEAANGPSVARGSRLDPIVEARHDVASLNNPKPPYPLSARRRGLEGRVLIAAQVRADGSCAEARVRQSSGYSLLDDSARDAVRRWRFVPARHGDKPVDSWVEVPIVFRLGS